MSFICSSFVPFHFICHYDIIKTMECGGNMQQFILPFISLALLLAALLICIRALLSRRFYLWIIPLVLTLGLGVFTFLVLLPLISKNPVNASLGLRGNPIVLYIFDALWL